MRVAQELNLTGQKLSKRLEELEQLYETRLAIVAGMYALKCQQKRFHDRHIIKKEFKLGELVLVYTFKKFQSKFFKASQGPFVISSVSSSGAVTLSTLDGEEMTKWISGCCVKKYYTLLTTQELEHLHKAKWRQENCVLIAKSAREEAKEQARKCRNRGVVPFDQGVTK